MNPKDTETPRISRAVNQLRSETVPSAGKAKTFDAMLERRRTGPRLPAMVSCGAVLLVSAMLLWPGRKAMGWQQVVQSTLSTGRLHHVDYVKAEQNSPWFKSLEEWIEPGKYAMRGHMLTTPDSPKVNFDMRDDGKRSYRLHWTGFGEVYNNRRHRTYEEWTKQYSLPGLLTDQRIRVEKTPTDVTLDGKNVLRYAARAFEGQVGSGFAMKMAFYVEPDSGRIVRTEHLDAIDKVTEYSVVDYPSSIPEDVFAPPTSGPKVFDLDHDADKLRAVMAKGVSIGHGNVLRAAIVSPSNEIVVLWTGAPPNGDGAQHPSPVGYAVKGVYAPDQTTSSRWKTSSKTWYRFNGQPLCGVSVQVTSSPTDKVTLRIPILLEDHHSPIRNSKGDVVGYRSKQVGVATVKDFPVLHTIPYSVLEYTRGNLQN